MQLALSLVPGGTERLTVEIARRLAGRFRMSVCCLDERGAWASQVEDAGVPVYVMDRQPGFHPSLGRRIAALASRLNVSVVHCHHFSPFVYGSIARFFKPSLGLVYTEHGRLSDAPPTMKRRLVNMVLSRVAGPSFAVAHDLRKYMLEEGFLDSRLGVIHNGIEIGPVPDERARAEARRQLAVPADAFVVGTVARLDPVKDFPTLVAAVARVGTRIPSVVLAVVGDGPERATIERAIAQTGAPVRMLGYSSAVRQLLPGFDAYANSSISEGISLTILEAMAAALPVVATRVGGTPEVVIDGETGRLVSARSVDEMAAAILALAESPARARDMGAAGRTRVERAFNIDRMVEDYAREYDRLIGRADTASAATAPTTVQS
jgi:glycosyltransferase involved in cell wall biosynthesis